ncbi:hypothetical protein BK010_05360 [Tenericutes bacterium MO-XQ]|nr:hypothetical protein BK010_05360 [Tenericutes bacterium MO-XQ]
MKKVFLLLILAVATFTLFGCNSSEYKVDGEFLAYEVSIHRNAPMVTMVSVTIEDGEVVAFNIDARQGRATQTEGADTTEDTSDDKWSYTWNAKTKKELGDDYGMVANGGAIAEWYEQAALIEAYMLENGVDSVEVDADTVITNITGVTIKDGGYTALAAEALELAKAGKFQAVYCTSDDLVIATMMVDEKGVATDLVLDVLQGRPDGATFAWRDQTKQELGLEYGMKDASTIGKEWFEQADAIAAYVFENGADSIQVNEDGDITNITGASVGDSGYSEVFALLFDFANYEV